MKILLQVNLVILVFLAISSGIAKLMLMPQEVEFFGGIGFSNLMLTIFGASQVIGGVMLALNNTRLVGAIIVSVTFTVSAIALFMSGNIMVGLVTCFTLLMLGMVMKKYINVTKEKIA